MNWYKKHILSSYAPEIACLRDYLKQGFNPYDFSFKIKDFLEEYDEMKPEWEDLEDYEVFDEWFKTATKDDQNLFEDYINKTPDAFDGYELDKPSYTAMDFIETAKPQWLVHFTNEPWSIKSGGFKYGHEDFEGLHLTTWKSENGRKRRPGYNFALELNSRATSSVAREHKYGKHCVVFWGAAVKSYHYGDEEYQMVFWGPSINTDMIFEMYSDGGEWEVKDATDRIMKKGGFEDCADWITQNYRMLQQIEKKNRK